MILKSNKMKKTLIISILSCLGILINAQDINKTSIKNSGEFVIITQNGETPILNIYYSFQDIETVTLRKNDIISIVVSDKLKPTSKLTYKRKEEELNSKPMVVVSTSEQIVHTESTAYGVAMESSVKPYRFTFDNLSLARSFAIELTNICNTK